MTKRKSTTPRTPKVAHPAIKSITSTDHKTSEIDSMTATEALNADIDDALAPDPYDGMDRDELEVEAGNWDIDIDSDMSDSDVRIAIRKAEAATDTSEADAFEATAAELAMQQVRPSVELARNAEQDAEYEARMTGSAAATSPVQAITVHNLELTKTGLAGCCPHCGKGTHGGDNVTEYSEMSPGTQNSTTQQFTCNDCAGEWGPVVDKPKRARAPSGTSNGLKIEQNRETRNGVTRPSVGGKCRGIWDMLDAMGVDSTAKQAREAGADKFDKTTIMVQFYRWRKFNGIEGRQA